MNETPKSEVTVEELSAFVAAVSKNVNDACHADYPTCEACWSVIYADGFDGKTQLNQRYARLVSTDEKPRGDSPRRSAYCFVDLNTGDILKTASWKAPAKRARGNIRDGNAGNWWNHALDKYGAAYLK